jgi:hypothetical protein
VFVREEGRIALSPLKRGEGDRLLDTRTNGHKGHSVRVSFLFLFFSFCDYECLFRPGTKEVKRKQETQTSKLIHTHTHTHTHTHKPQKERLRAFLETENVHLGNGWYKSSALVQNFRKWVFGHRPFAGVRVVKMSFHHPKRKQIEQARVRRNTEFEI